MTLVTLRPSGDVSNTGVITGGGSAAGALNDNSDATYVTYTLGQRSVVNLGDLTLPAGAVVKTVQMRARVSQTGGGIASTLTAELSSSGAPFASKGSVTAPASATTFAVGPAETGWTDAQIDAATMLVACGGSASSSIRVFETYVDVVYVTQPVVTVTAPTGTITTTNTPPVIWSNALDTSGGPQTGFHVKVFTAAQYGIGGFDPAVSPSTYDSTAQGGSGTILGLTTVLANATYRAYVRTRQTVNGVDHWSAWAFGGFIINVTPPAVPTLALTPSNTLGKIQAVITTGGGATSTDRVELQRSVDGGTTWVAVRNTETDDGTITYPAAPVTIQDYEAPNGTLTSYRARALHNYSGVYAASAWSTTATATWTATDWWIKHPNVPTLNLKLTRAMFSYPDVTRAARQTAFQPVGAVNPIVVSDTRGGATGTVIVQLATLVEQNALDALLNTVATLLLQGPAAEGHPDRYVRFGDHSSVRVTDKSFSLVTRESLPWVEVASPPAAQA